MASQSRGQKTSKNPLKWTTDIAQGSGDVPKLIESTAIRSPLLPSQTPTHTLEDSHPTANRTPANTSSPPFPPAIGRPCRTAPPCRLVLGWSSHGRRSDLP